MWVTYIHAGWCEQLVCQQRASHLRIMQFSSSESQCSITDSYMMNLPFFRCTVNKQGNTGDGWWDTGAGAWWVDLTASRWVWLCGCQLVNHTDQPRPPLNFDLSGICSARLDSLWRCWWSALTMRCHVFREVLFEDAKHNILPVLLILLVFEEYSGQFLEQYCWKVWGRQDFLNVFESSVFCSLSLHLLQSSVSHDPSEIILIADLLLKKHCLL